MLAADSILTGHGQAADLQVKALLKGVKKMLRINSIKLSLDESELVLKSKAASILGIDEKKISKIRIIKM